MLNAPSLEENMIQVCKTFVWLAIVATFLRGLFVFDLGVSAEHNYPTASAICLVGSILAAAIMLRASPSNGDAQ
jgi:hypothetical protein